MVGHYFNLYYLEAKFDRQFVCDFLKSLVNAVNQNRTAILWTEHNVILTTIHNIVIGLVLSCHEKYYTAPLHIMQLLAIMKNVMAYRPCGLYPHSSNKGFYAAG